MEVEVRVRTYTSRGEGYGHFLPTSFDNDWLLIPSRKSLHFRMSGLCRRTISEGDRVIDLDFMGVTTELPLRRFTTTYKTYLHVSLSRLRWWCTNPSLCTCAIPPPRKKKKLI